MKNKDKLIAVVEKIAREENKSPETVVSELNNMSEEQINNKLKMINFFKDGGKLDYLLCLKKGGSIKNCGCGGAVKKKLDGGVTDSDPDSNTNFIRETKPSGWKGLFFRPTKYQYPSEDGIRRMVSEYVTPQKDTITRIEAPYTTFERSSSPDGEVVYWKAVGSDAPQDTTDPDIVNMFKKIRMKFVDPSNNSKVKINLKK